MSYSQEQVKTLLADAVQQLQHMKRLHVDRDVYILIRQELEDQAARWLHAEGGVSYGAFAFDEVERLDELHGI